MIRKKQIRDAPMYFAKKNENTSIPYVDFIEAVEWADETMIENMCQWLENNIDKYTTVLHSINGDELEEHVVLTKSFKEDFKKAMEE